MSTTVLCDYRQVQTSSKSSKSSLIQAVLNHLSHLRRTFSPVQHNADMTIYHSTKVTVKSCFPHWKFWKKNHYKHALTTQNHTRDNSFPRNLHRAIHATNAGRKQPKILWEFPSKYVFLLKRGIPIWERSAWVLLQPHLRQIQLISMWKSWINMGITDVWFRCEISNLEIRTAKVWVEANVKKRCWFSALQFSK